MTRTNLTSVNVLSLNKLMQAAEHLVGAGAPGWLHVMMKSVGFDGERPSEVNSVDLVVTQSTREFQLRIEFTYTNTEREQEKATFWLSFEDGAYSGDIS